MEEPLILPFAHARHPREGGDPALARANRICSKQICSKAHRTPSQSRPAAHGWAAPVLAAMEGEARGRDWLGVQCAVGPTSVVLANNSTMRRNAVIRRCRATLRSRSAPVR